MNLLNLIIYFEFSAFIAGCIYYRKYFDTYLKYFIILLGLVVILELSIWSMYYFFNITFQNKWVYNVITTLQYLYYLTLYHKILKNVSYKRLIRGFIVLFVISVVLNFSFVQKLNGSGLFHSYTFILGAIILIIAIGLFFAETLNTDKVLYFKKYLMFWISIGLFVFYTAVIPVIVSINFLPESMAPTTLSAILFTLNFIMYMCFTVGFIISRKYTD